MRIAETCPDCGAERPSWLGSSHHTKNYRTMERHVPMCHDGRSPAQVFEEWKPTTFAPLGSQRWPEL